MSDDLYTSALADYVDKCIRRWASQKKKTLEPKLSRNFDAVTNRDFRVKQWKKEEGKDWRSTTWIGFVRVKVWAFYAVMLDTVLKAGKIPFDLEPSPYDEQPGEEYVRERDARIERMRDKIESQLVARNADREYMKKWLSGAYYGMAFSKFNIEPVRSTEFKQVGVDVGEASQYLSPEEMQQYTRYEMVQEEEDTPGHRYVSVWNMVWDMEPDRFEDGQGYAEHIKSCAYDLKKLVNQPGYIKDAIERVIARKLYESSTDTSEAPAESPAKNDLEERQQKFSRFEFYMRAPRKIVEEYEQGLKSGRNEVTRLTLMHDYEDAEESGDDVEIMGEIVEKEIIRYVRNDTGKRAHKMWVVEANLDESTGNGIPDNMEDVQAMLIGMIRSFEDNKKLSANVTSAVKSRFFNNPDQLNDITPGKQYDIADSCDDVRKAIMPIIFSDVGESLISGITLGFQLKDDVSMIPTIMQGFNLPKHQPDTAYEMRQLTENAGKYIGQAIRNDDEQFIEPEIRDLYEYNMLFGEDESLKVNCKVKANGFTSFQNKEIRGERMRQALATFVTNEILMPYVRVKPHLDVIYESMDEDPEKFIKSEEEIAEQQQAQQQAQEEQEAKMLQIQQAMMQLEAQIEMSKKAIEVKAGMAEKGMEHKQKLEEAVLALRSAVQQAGVNNAFQMARAEQQHKNEMETEVLKAELEAMYPQPQASQGGS